LFLGRRVRRPRPQATMVELEELAATHLGLFLISARRAEERKLDKTLLPGIL
jgi:hypothetical protein